MIEPRPQVRAGRPSPERVGAVELRPRRRGQYALEDAVERDDVAGDLVVIDLERGTGAEREALPVGRRKGRITELFLDGRTPDIVEVAV